MAKTKAKLKNQSDKPRAVRHIPPPNAPSTSSFSNSAYFSSFSNAKSIELLPSTLPIPRREPTHASQHSSTHSKYIRVKANQTLPPALSKYPVHFNLSILIRKIELYKNGVQPDAITVNVKFWGSMQSDVLYTANALKYRVVEFSVNCSIPQFLQYLNDQATYFEFYFGKSLLGLTDVGIEKVYKDGQTQYRFWRDITGYAGSKDEGFVVGRALVDIRFEFFDSIKKEIKDEKSQTPSTVDETDGKVYGNDNQVQNEIKPAPSTKSNDSYVYEKIPHILSKLRSMNERLIRVINLNDQNDDLSIVSKPTSSRSSFIDTSSATTTTKTASESFSMDLLEMSSIYTQSTASSHTPKPSTSVQTSFLPQLNIPKLDNFRSSINGNRGFRNLNFSIQIEELLDIQCSDVPGLKLMERSDGSEIDIDELAGLSSSFATSPRSDYYCFWRLRMNSIFEFIDKITASSVGRIRGGADESLIFETRLRECLVRNDFLQLLDRSEDEFTVPLCFPKTWDLINISSPIYIVLELVIQDKHGKQYIPGICKIALHSSQLNIFNTESSDELLTFRLPSYTYKVVNILENKIVATVNISLQIGRAEDSAQNATENVLPSAEDMNFPTPRASPKKEVTVPEPILAPTAEPERIPTPDPIERRIEFDLEIRRVVNLKSLLIPIVKSYKKSRLDEKRERRRSKKMQYLKNFGGGSVYGNSSIYGKQQNEMKQVDAGDSAEDEVVNDEDDEYNVLDFAMDVGVNVFARFWISSDIDISAIRSDNEFERDESPIVDDSISRELVTSIIANTFTPNFQHTERLITEPLLHGTARQSFTIHGEVYHTISKKFNCNDVADRLRTLGIHCEKVNEDCEESGWNILLGRCQMVVQLNDCRVWGEIVGVGGGKAGLEVAVGLREAEIDGLGGFSGNSTQSKLDEFVKLKVKRVSNLRVDDRDMELAIQCPRKNSRRYLKLIYDPFQRSTTKSDFDSQTRVNVDVNDIGGLVHAGSYVKFSINVGDDGAKEVIASGVLYVPEFKALRKMIKDQDEIGISNGNEDKFMKWCQLYEIDNPVFCDVKVLVELDISGKIQFSNEPREFDVEDVKSVGTGATVDTNDLNLRFGRVNPDVELETNSIASMLVEDPFDSVSTAASDFNFKSSTRIRVHASSDKRKFQKSNSAGSMAQTPPRQTKSNANEWTYSNSNRNYFSTSRQSQENNPSNRETSQSNVDKFQQNSFSKIASSSNDPSAVSKADNIGSVDRLLNLYNYSILDKYEHEGLENEGLENNDQELKLEMLDDLSEVIDTDFDTRKFLDFGFQDIYSTTIAKKSEEYISNDVAAGNELEKHENASVLTEEFENLAQSGLFQRLVEMHESREEINKGANDVDLHPDTKPAIESRDAQPISDNADITFDEKIEELKPVGNLQEEIRTKLDVLEENSELHVKSLEDTDLFKRLVNAHLSENDLEKGGGEGEKKEPGGTGLLEDYVEVVKEEIPTESHRLLNDAVAVEDDQTGTLADMPTLFTNEILKKNIVPTTVVNPSPLSNEIRSNESVGTSSSSSDIDLEANNDDDEENLDDSSKVVVNSDNNSVSDLDDDEDSDSDDEEFEKLSMISKKYIEKYAMMVDGKEEEEGNENIPVERLFVPISIRNLNAQYNREDGKQWRDESMLKSGSVAIPKTVDLKVRGDERAQSQNKIIDGDNTDVKFLKLEAEIAKRKEEIRMKIGRVSQEDSNRFKKVFGSGGAGGVSLGGKEWDSDDSDIW